MGMRSLWPEQQGCGGLSNFSVCFSAPTQALGFPPEAVSEDYNGIGCFGAMLRHLLRQLLRYQRRFAVCCRNNRANPANDRPGIAQGDNNMGRTAEGI
jgi:hypothetical protein